MSNFFDLIYSAVAFLGRLPFRLIGMLFKLIFKAFKSLFKPKGARKGLSPEKKRKILIKAVSLILIIALLGVTFAFVSENSTKVEAIRLKFGDEIVGYANSQTEVDIAKAYALKVLGTYDKEIKEENVKTEASNIKTASALSESIVEISGKELESVYEIYLNDNLLCAVKDIAEARKAVTETYELTAKLYPDSAVAFSQALTFVPVNYAKGSANISDTTQLKQILATTLRFMYAKCEENLSTTAFDTVEIQTNTLFTGDTRVRREGENGTEYQVNLVKYTDNQKVLTEQLINYSVTTPVSKIVERGIRAQSLSMGTYTVYQTTGIFCWPAVDLYKVTSPYGSRSLGYHRGIDISGANAAGKYVVAGAAGVVIAAGWNNGGYGNHVRIDHGNGMETLYAHMLNDSIMVNVGDVVQRGQAIGKVGNTGRSFGAHLHFEVRINGNRLNPAPYLGLQ